MSYRCREFTHGGMTFMTESSRKGLFYFSVLDPDRCQWVHCGDPIHGRPSEPQARKHMVHYAKIALAKLETQNG